MENGYSNKTLPTQRQLINKSDTSSKLVGDQKKSRITKRGLKIWF